MSKADLLKIARRTGIDLEQLARWQVRKLPRHELRGRRRGPVKRPRGCLSMTDARTKYGLRLPVLVAWRKAGMPTTKIGKLIAVRESVLKKWITKMGFKVYRFEVNGKTVVTAYGPR